MIYLVKLCLFQFVECSCISDLFLVFYAGRDIFVNKNTGHTVTDENLIPKEERQGIKDASFRLKIFNYTCRLNICLKMQEAHSADFEVSLIFF